MIGIVLIYYLGKYFYDLADQYGKSKWGFAILGVASYYGTLILVGLTLGFVSVIAELDFIEDTPPLLLDLLAIPFGALAAWLLYRLLEKKWRLNEEKLDVEVLDSGLS